MRDGLNLSSNELTSARRLRSSMIVTVVAVLAMTASTMSPLPASAAEVAANSGLLIRSDDPRAFNNFGGAIAVSADGSTFVVGATERAIDGRNESAVFVFAANGLGGYAQRAMLIADDASLTENEWFGWQVAISANGEIVVVGTPQDNDAGETSGSVYVFVENGAGGYDQTAKLVAQDATAGDIFGESVAVSASGDTVLVGARGHGEGSVFVFSSDGAGGYEQAAKLTADDVQAGDAFGFSLSMSDDGMTIVVSASGQDVSSGAVYVFVANGVGGYEQSAKLTTSDAAHHENFGHTVKLSGDATIIAAGSSNRGELGSGSGAVYVFIADGGGGYQEANKLTASDAHFDLFGSSIALSGDDSTLVVGARLNDDKGADSGSAYLFMSNGGGGYDEQPILLAHDGFSGDLYGSAVGLSNDGETILVGSPRHDDRTNTAPNTGAVYVYGPHVIDDRPSPSDQRPADDQILRLYQAVFGRAPDPGGFGFWTSQYRNGRSLGDIVDGFMASAEFVGRYGSNPSDRELVEAMYLNVLNRRGDSRGIEYWLRELASGMSANELLRLFADSPENIANTKTSQPLTSNEAKVLRLYRAVLGRAPDDEGFAFWVDQAAVGRSMRSIAGDFIDSPEFRERYGVNPSDRVLVDGLYRNVLGRAGDASGIEFWLGQRSDGMTVAELLIAFADSAENLQRTGTQP